MATLPESNTFEAVRQWEITDPALGGAGTLFTMPVQNLTNRTKYLKTLLDNVIAGTQGMIGTLLNGSTTVNEYSDFQQSDTAIASTAFVQGAVALKGGRRNALLNGGMEISQRGEGFTIGAGEGMYTLDRWYTQGDIGSADNFRIYRDNNLMEGLFSGFKYCMKIFFNSAATTLTVRQRINNGRTFEGGNAVLSFALSLTANCNVRAKLSRYLNQTQMDAGTPEWTSNSVISCLSGFNNYTKVFAVPDVSSSLTLTAEDDGCLELSLIFEHTTGTSVTAGLTNVQLEKGAIPGSFEQRDDLAECLTYFELTQVYEKYDRSITSDGGAGIPPFYTRQYWGAKRRVPRLSVENLNLVNVSEYSFDQQSRNACTLVWQPSSTTMTVSYRLVEMDLHIDAEL